jgi:type 1 glutamine amidotransferase
MSYHFHLTTPTHCISTSIDYTTSIIQPFATDAMTKLISLVALALLHTSLYAQPLKLLYLGDNGHHQPRVRYQQLAPEMKQRGIELVYTDQMKDLNATTLKDYAGLVVYANIDSISKEQADALLTYVAEGKGFIPLHCASYCFRNNDDIVKLIGAQFKSHGTGTFRTVQAKVNHPILNGFKSFESWDETYVHTKHNDENRMVLEHRVEGDKKEPWTWVRTHGKGRVFYTAWGHDERTWAHPGFQNLVERGIRWACNADMSKVTGYADAPR